MKSTSFKVALLFIFVLSISLAGCRRKTALTGRLIVQTHNALYSLAPKEDSQVGESLISDEVVSAAASPDGRYLIYSRAKSSSNSTSESSDGETLLRDLQSGTEKQVFNHRVTGLSWSSDGLKFSFTRQHKLYVATLNGESQLVYSEPSQPYSNIFGQPTNALFAASSDAKWLGRDRFVLQTGGQFEGVVYDQNGPAPNSTQLVILGNSVKINEVSQRWFVGSQCAPKSLALLARSADAEKIRENWEFIIGSPLFMTRDFEDFEKTAPKPLPYQKAFFMPRSCRLYSIASTISSDQATVKFHDPETLTEERHLSLKGNREIIGALSDLNEKSIVLWYSIPDDPASSNQKDSKKYGLSVVDLSDGRETELMASSNLPGATLSSNMRGLKILAWLDN